MQRLAEGKRAERYKVRGSVMWVSGDCTWAHGSRVSRERVSVQCRCSVGAVTVEWKGICKWMWEREGYSFTPWGMEGYSEVHCYRRRVQPDAR